MITSNGIPFVFLHFSFPKLPTHFIVFFLQNFYFLCSFQRPIIFLPTSNRLREGFIGPIVENLTHQRPTGIHKIMNILTSMT